MLIYLFRCSSLAAHRRHGRLAQLRSCRRVVLAAFYSARMARLTRSAVLEVLGEEYVLTARAKGLGEGRVIGKHTLRNSAIPIVTLAGLEAGQLLGGAVITETIFAWPGLGRLTVQALLNRDFPVVLAAVFLHLGRLHAHQPRRRPALRLARPARRGSQRHDRPRSSPP